MKKFLCFLCLLHPAVVSGQIIASGNLESRITGIINNMPLEGTNEYQDPTMVQLSEWEAMFHNLLDADYATAATQAADLDYDLVQFTDTGNSQVYYLLENNGGNYWGTYVFYPAYTKSLVVQSPHPRKDFNTGKQGARVFRESGSMSFFMAGTHRCNQQDSVVCSGKTTVCSDDGETNEKYRRSDVAHNDSTVFQITTELIYNRFSDSFFLQLHGFTKEGSDPYVILSNGTTELPAEDYLGVLKTELLVQDPELTFQVPHENTEWNRLTGSTNTQGRFINGSLSPCTTSVSANSGRFIHMEQEKFRLRNDETGWMKVANAVNAAFSTPLPVTYRSFTATVVNNRAVHLAWTTLTEKDNELFQVQHSLSGREWHTVGTLPGNGTTSQPQAYEFIHRQNVPGIHYYRFYQQDYDGKHAYSPVKVVQLSASIREEIRLVPNPAAGRLSVKGISAPVREIRFISSDGKDLSHRVKVLECTEHATVYDISKLTAGLYYVKVVGSGSEKLVVW